MTFRDVFLPGGDESSHLHDGGDISGQMPFVRVVAGVNIPDLASRLATAEGDISTLKGHSHHSIDFDSAVDPVNQTLDTTFVTSVTLNYSPPAGWSTYKIQGDVSVMVAGVNAGDSIQLAAQIDGNVGTVVDDNAASTSRFLVAYIELSGLSGAIDLEARVRNITAARGAAYTSWARITAVREDS